jgi:hypothetical protein
VSRENIEAPSETFVLIGIVTVSSGFDVCKTEVVGSRMSVSSRKTGGGELRR